MVTGRVAHALRRMESVTLTVKNDPRPEKGLGVEFNDMNAVVAIMKGGVAAKS